MLTHFGNFYADNRKRDSSKPIYHYGALPFPSGIFPYVGRGLAPAVKGQSCRERIYAFRMPCLRRNG